MNANSSADIIRGASSQLQSVKVTEWVAAPWEHATSLMLTKAFTMAQSNIIERSFSSQDIEVDRTLTVKQLLR